MTVFIPQHGSECRKYCISCLLAVFLGIDFNLIIEEDASNVRIEINGKILIIEDHFFSKFRSGRILFDSDYLPVSVHSGNLNIDNKKFALVSLYGTNILSEVNDTITLHSDIIASTFFMLSRWEESANPWRDSHGRFPATESLAYKHNFLHRPIVNEYVELLWAILQKMGCTQKRKKWEYKLIPTHDVDIPYLFNGVASYVRGIVARGRRGRYREVVRYGKHLIRGNDPFDTYDQLMDLAERENTTAHFFFLQSGNAKQDEKHNIDTPKIKKLIRHISNREHQIGFHPSYETVTNPILFGQEKLRLEEVAGKKVTTGRHHFLRWDTAATPSLWNDHGMEWDSTLGYADHVGFRCGVCYPFPLYDLKNDKQLDVYERPLIAMEWSLVGYQNLNLELAKERIDHLKTEVKKYNSEFVFLYHNSAFFTDEYVAYGDNLLSAFYS